MRDTYDVAEHEWDEEELIEAIYELIAKNNGVLDLVSKRFKVTYYSCDKALSVIIEAETFNKAMIEFATYYHLKDEVYGMIEI